jgi:hypothetical protein
VGKAIVFSRALIGIGLSATLVACGGGGGGSSSPASPIAGGGSGSGGGTSTDACGVAAQIEFVETVATSYYYWYDELADVKCERLFKRLDYLACDYATRLV